MALKDSTSLDPKSFYNHTMPDKLGDDYEDARWRANPFLAAQYRMMVDVIGRLVAPKVQSVRQVLEVGPGPGTWTKLLLATNATAEYTLVDISKEMLSQAEQGLTNHTNIKFVETDLLTFDSAHLFDFFFSSRAIEYMPDKEAAVRKIVSLLEPHAEGAIITKMPKPFFDQLKGRSSGFHGAQIAPATLASLLRKNGCAVGEVRIATATVPLIGSPWLNEFFYGFLKHIPLFSPCTFFAESYLITFRKSV